jgi:predicted DNA-binding transcriptional regulator AlpA
MDSEGPAGAQEAEGIDGAAVVDALGCMPEGAILTERSVCSIFGRSRWSVRRAIQRGELPPPTRLFGKAVWTAGAVIRHIEAGMDEAARDAAQLRARLIRLAV